MKYEAVIGLEVHAHLLTDSKIFCGCPTIFGAEPNTQTCPICIGMPGVLPVLNKKAVVYAVKMALATNCTMNEKSVFARKNYFYPDLPKGYQISQYDKPLAEHGNIDIEAEGQLKTIGITRIHMEEDAGKLIHAESVTDDSSFVDLNRTGVPLIEIVSEPDMRTPEEATAYLKVLRDILLYLGICDCNMEEGSFRCDANVSIRPVGETRLGTKAELKNMNSFKFIRDALAYEITRQTEAIEDGTAIVQETRLFDPGKGETRSMRTKEEAHDYRYFPEPDLLPLVVDPREVEQIRSTLPELPAEKRERFITKYDIPPYDAAVITASRELADFYEETVKLYNEPKTVSNWVMGELLRLLKEHSKFIADCPMTPKDLSGLLEAVKAGRISSKMAKGVFEEMFTSGSDADTIIEEQGLSQISDMGELTKIIDEVLGINPDNVERYRAGKDKLFGFFVGQVMKATKGQANPELVSKILKQKLS